MLTSGLPHQPPVDLGLHFDGIGALPRMKLRPEIARKMLLEAHKWTGEVRIHKPFPRAEPDD